ncbi:MAG: HAD-IA family hydrolase [Gaiellaceae bacterium]
MLLSTVIFDLDGTVIDTGPLIADSFRHAVKTVLGKTIDDREMLAFVGGWSLREQMCRLAPDRSQELVEAYRAYNEPRHAGLEFCPGMHELLLALRAKDVRIGLATAKRRSTVEIAFRYLPQLEGLFDVVVSADDTERHKPDPAPLLLALDKLGAKPDDGAYVGDSPFDVEAARAAGLRSIAVTWGGIHDQKRLRLAGPDTIVSTTAELIDALEVSPA